jgi:dinuclear metal center YbgI/SA1388 family protein
MLELIDITHYLDQLLSPKLFDDYAPNGLQIEGKKPIRKLAGSVSATQEAVDQALKWGADGLIVHHGVLWRHQGARPLTGAYGERVQKIIKNDLSLWAYHLPLDSHSEIGNAKALADVIGMNTLSPFGPYKKQFLGVQGKLNQPQSAAAFKKDLEKKLNHPITLASHDENQMIKTLGIITGGANNEWSEALNAGLDAYLTGEISEYNWHDAREAKIHYFAGGHHATERFGIQALLKKINQDLKIETQFFDSLNPA